MASIIIENCMCIINILHYHKGKLEGIKKWIEKIKIKLKTVYKNKLKCKKYEDEF